MSRIFRLALTLSTAAVLGLSAVGCGSEGTDAVASDDPAAESRKVALSEIGEMFRLAQQDGKPKPQQGDFARYSMLSMVGYQKLQEGNLVVLWGRPRRAQQHHHRPRLREGHPHRRRLRPDARLLHRQIHDRRRVQIRPQGRHPRQLAS